MPLKVKINKRIRDCIIIAISFIFVAWIDPFRDEVSDGNSEFHQKKYNEAKKHYKKAENYAPGEEDKKKLSFNKGDADYMSGNQDSAIINYQRALQSEDKEVQKKALFNIGNTYLRKGDYKEAVNYFINALKIDPNYKRAKKNIEYILKRKDNQNNKGNNKNKGGNQQGNDKQGNDKQEKENKQQGDDKSSADGRQRSTPKQMNREQVKNILDSMKKKPVRRMKGSSNDKRYLEKFW